jgi:hypothetical protein
MAIIAISETVLLKFETHLNPFGAGYKYYLDVTP